MAKASLRGAYGKTLLRLGRDNPDIVVLDADLAKSTKTITFGKEIADRFIDSGLSEQDMISTAAGLSLTGKVVFASSFCVFLVGRVYDQVRQSVCYNNANVKLIATHSGLGVGEDGATHQALEDIAMLRPLPHMRVIAPADALETVQVIEYVAGEPGPFFVRLTRSDLETVYDDSYRFRFGRASILREGGDIAIVAIGAMVEKALQAAEILSQSAVEATVVNMSTVKPLDGDLLSSLAAKVGGIITMEDHSVAGGLGGAVAEFLGQNAPLPLKIIGVENQFGRSGTPEELYRLHGLTAQRAAAEAKKLLEGGSSGR
jgi:transketolase